MTTDENSSNQSLGASAYCRGHIRANIKQAIHSVCWHERGTIMDLLVTKETVVNFEDYVLEAELMEICGRIMKIGLPENQKQSSAITEARKLAATHLHELGYSHRQIMKALGLKSPQSITEYLKADEAKTEVQHD